MPEWHPFLGHLLCLPPILKRLPLQSQQPDAFTVLVRDFIKLDGLFYLDLRPFSNPLLVVTSPPLATQSCQQHALAKPHILKPFFQPLAGGDNTFIINGAERKRSRALFNSGFNANCLLGQLGHILEETVVYVEIMRERAKKGSIFSSDEVTLWFTLDCIGAVTLLYLTRSPTCILPAATSRITDN